MWTSAASPPGYASAKSRDAAPKQDSPPTQAMPERLVAVKLPSLANKINSNMSQAHHGSEHNTDSADSEGTCESAHRMPPGLQLDGLISHINHTRSLYSRKSPPSSTSGDNICLVGEASGRIRWIQPSGPRRPGEGTDEGIQGIVSADLTASGGAIVRITLLASGFVIGPAGQSVRDICKVTGADIKSWTEPVGNRPCRTYVIEGEPRTVMHALEIVCDAVDHYKRLCEGAFCGQAVSRTQAVHGINFSYQPPPRNVVPYAAALKGQGSRSRGFRDSSGSAEYAAHILANVRSHIAASGDQSSSNTTFDSPASSYLSPGPYASKRPVASIPPGFPRAPSPYHLPSPATPQYQFYAEDAHSITFVDPAGQLMTVPRSSMSDPATQAWQRPQASPYHTSQDLYSPHYHTAPPQGPQAPGPYNVADLEQKFGMLRTGSPHGNHSPPVWDLDGSPACHDAIQAVHGPRAPLTQPPNSPDQAPAPAWASGPIPVRFTVQRPDLPNTSGPGPDFGPAITPPSASRGALPEGPHAATAAIGYGGPSTSGSSPWVQGMHPLLRA